MAQVVYLTQVYNEVWMLLQYQLEMSENLAGIRPEWWNQWKHIIFVVTHCIIWCHCNVHSMSMGVTGSCWLCRFILASWLIPAIWIIFPTSVHFRCPEEEQSILVKSPERFSASFEVVSEKHSSSCKSQLRSPHLIGTHYVSALKLQPSWIDWRAYLWHNKSMRQCWIYLVQFNLLFIPCVCHVSIC